MRLLPGYESRISQDEPPPQVTRERAHVDQHLRILRAVGELAGEHGYQNLTLEAIVKRAHVSYRTFYIHFSDKEHCLLALFDNALRATEATIGKRLAAEPRPWPERVALVLETLIELILAEPLISRAVIVEAPQVGPGGLERYHHAARALAPLFREGRELCSPGVELAPTLENALAGSVFWSLYQALLVNRPEGLPELLPQLIGTVVRSYDPRAALRRRPDAHRRPEPASSSVRPSPSWLPPIEPRPDLATGEPD